MARKNSKKAAKKKTLLEIAKETMPCVKTRDEVIVPETLYIRAKKKVGLSDERIRSYPDAESLKQYLDGIHPNSNPDSRVKQGKPPEPAKFEENMPGSFTLESILEAKFISTNREHFDNKNLQDFLLRVNRRYGVQHPVRIVKDVSFVVKNRELVTKFEIFFK